MPVIRHEPEDFIVDEEPLYPPSGEGGHTFVHVEKRLRNTEDVARLLAEAAGVRSSEIGYAGRKDRRAVTRQWLSVPGLDPARAKDLEWPGIVVLDAVPHRHKLRTGQLRANHFEITVRDLDPAAIDPARGVAAEVASRGLANRYGPQRFGRGGANVDRALAMVQGKIRVRDRRKARFLYSALQAHVFNTVLDARPLPPHRVVLGDVAQVVASGGLFLVEDLDREQERAEAFEISPTGPIIGPKATIPGPEVAELESRALGQLGLGESGMTPPPGVRARGGRRALRAPVPDLTLDVQGDVARLVFTLPPGSYATVLLDAIFGPVDEPVVE